ncbi:MULTISPECIES: nucleotidyltransferase family protein [Comamonas]|jgi:MurNAc alpha-1-phosphate uridylyltransferase|uniref:Nucleotidyltransferase family protein n=1 Tax=Comamonas squillarum TaxID=2977320 RepID=A0ABY6A247_9BURK|nr:nucleotidyltransferase family protein [Comamonas sp. PR12]UXC19758.1 nucleotidyltransferase family protein [Comamonas sp. PR12]
MSFPLDFRAQAMVLAAGRGERMRPLTDHTPKPLLPVQGKPLMQYSMEQLARAGVQRLVINTGWLGQQVADAWPAAPALAQLGSAQLQIAYSREDLDFGGGIETSGGISRALPLLDDAFWLVSGDVFIPGFPFDEALRQRFAHSDDLAHLWLVPNASHHPKGDFVLTAEGRAQNPAADDPRPRLTYCSVALLKKTLFSAPYCDIPAGNPQGTKMPLVQQLRAAMQAGRCSASRYDGRWVDVGTAERLQALNP